MDASLNNDGIITDMKNNLFTMSGVAAIVSGLLFVIIQVIHPPANALSEISSSLWMWAHVLTFLFPIFGILGLTGIYLKQADKAGYWGLAGYLGLFGAFVLMICFGFYEAFVATGLMSYSPEYVADAMTILDGEAGPGLIGLVYSINGALYILGGLIFGITTLRAKVFPVWAGGLLLLGILAILSAAIMPFMERPSAIVFGAGLMALGVSLVLRPKR